MVKLIGKLKERFHKLKIKDNVVLVGLSLQQELLKVHSSSMDKMILHQNNNLLTVQEAMVIKDVVVDGWIQPSNT